jgi:hypothetical protein
LEIVEGQADLDAVFTVCSLSWFCFPHFSLPCSSKDAGII